MYTYMCIVRGRQALENTRTQNTYVLRFELCKRTQIPISRPLQVEGVFILISFSGSAHFNIKFICIFFFFSLFPFLPRARTLVSQPAVVSSSPCERMAHQQILINGNQTQPGNLHTIQHYLVNNQIHSTSSTVPQQNVHVQIVKQDPQRYVIQNRQYVQQQQQQLQQHQSSQNGNAQSQMVQVSAHPPQQTMHQQQQEIPIYWLIVEIESNNEQNCYGLVESKDVMGSPPFDTLNTGKLVLINGEPGKPQIRATVVMASRELLLMK